MAEAPTPVPFEEFREGDYIMMRRHVGTKGPVFRLRPRLVYETLESGNTRNRLDGLERICVVPMSPYKRNWVFTFDAETHLGEDFVKVPPPLDFSKTDGMQKRPDPSGTLRKATPAKPTPVRETPVVRQERSTPVTRTGMTKRAYLISLGLAKEGRGRFSREGNAALDKARQSGTTFIDD